MHQAEHHIAATGKSLLPMSRMGQLPMELIRSMRRTAAILSRTLKQQVKS